MGQAPSLLPQVSQNVCVMHDSWSMVHSHDIDYVCRILCPSEERKHMRHEGDHEIIFVFEWTKKKQKRSAMSELFYKKS